MQYDVAYQQQAAATGNTKWSVVNPTLYTMYFTGLALPGVSSVLLPPILSRSVPSRVTQTLDYLSS